MVSPVIRAVTSTLPGRAGFLAIRALAAKIPRSPATAEQEMAFLQARKIRYGKQGSNTAWEWGEGPLVILVHGWAGSAVQLAPLAAHISAQGFRCVAIEVTGHGHSAGDRTSWAHFIADISALSNELAVEVQAFVGHSAGGLAMMAARALNGLSARKYVCICAPSHPYPPINVVRQRLNPRPSAIGHYKKFIADQFHSSWENLENGAAYQGGDDRLLLVYDEGDRFVNPADGATIQAWCPGARLVMTSAYGHTRILAAPELFEAIVPFIQ